MKIYHNPRCTKSRETLELIQKAGKEPEIVEYLKDTPSKAELKAILKKLGMKPQDIIRKNEQVYKDIFKGKDLSDDEWIDAMIQHPKLIERPIVVEGENAIIGRPPENVFKLLKP